MFDPDELREVDGLAVGIGALLDEFGGVEAVRELEILRFRCQLNEDAEGAERALRRIAELGLANEASNHLLAAFFASMQMQNAALARAAFAGVEALVQAKLAGEATNDGDPDEGGGEG